MDWNSLFITLKLACITTTILLVVSIPLAYKLAYSKYRFKAIFESLISLPLVLPPTVLGFYLLVAFSPDSVLGSWIQQVFHTQLLFSFPGLVVGSLVYSLPFMVHPLQTGFLSISEGTLNHLKLLDISTFKKLVKVLLPSIKPSIVMGVVLTFAHTIGEFGVVLMIGGNIPGKTRVASIAIYDQVEALNYSGAHQLSAILVGGSFLILLATYAWNKRHGGTLWKF